MTPFYTSHLFKKKIRKKPPRRRSTGIACQLVPERRRDASFWQAKQNMQNFRHPVYNSETNYVLGSVGTQVRHPFGVREGGGSVREPRALHLWARVQQWESSRSWTTCNRIQTCRPSSSCWSEGTFGRPVRSACCTCAKEKKGKSISSVRQFFLR